MDALPFIIERISEPPFQKFLSNNGLQDSDYLDFVVKELVKVQRYMRWSDFMRQPEYQKQALIKGLRLTVRKVGKFMTNIREQCVAIDELVNEWGDILDIIAGIVHCCYELKGDQVENEFSLEEFDGENFEEIEILYSITVFSDHPKLDEHNSLQLFLLKAFPVLTTEYSEPTRKRTFLVELSKELDNLPQLICKACDGLPLALVLVGSLLSLKEKINDIWKRVKVELDDIWKRVKVELDAFENDGNLLLNIIIYCYKDLPYFLKPCFLYLACYPKAYKIPSRSLISMWIAEGFISTESKEETVEETAYKYLEQLVKRSLVKVSERSFLGSIKYCCVEPNIHQFAIDQSREEEFLVANPDKRTIESLFRVAIHSDNNHQYGELEINHIHSFLALNFHQNILRNALFLTVLELLGSTVPQATLPKMTFLRYLCLRHTSIITLPENIEVMQNLQTLDIRNTNIKTIPESLWNISTLRHVYVVASPDIKGPPPTANITDLQTLKTVAVPKLWVNRCPQFLISVRKLALTNPDDLDWKSVSHLLSQSVNLLSLTIISKSVPSELADTRAFPNLETVKSIQLEGKWSCRMLFIDNIEFSPNLTKLTLNKSGLTKDPMPRLEKLKSLKFLSLQDGAYTGNQMACSAKGFPQLEYLELLKLVNLEQWVREAMGMSKLRKLRVVECDQLRDVFPDLQRVTIQRS